MYQIDVECWLNVVPQIIAKMDINSTKIQKGIRINLKIRDSRFTYSYWYKRTSAISVSNFSCHEEQISTKKSDLIDDQNQSRKKL